MSGFNLSVEILMVQARVKEVSARGKVSCFNLSVEILMVQAPGRDTDVVVH